MTSTTTSTTMRAVTQDGYGGAEVLRVAEVAPPLVGDHEVLVRVSAAGLDRGTQHLMTGTPYAVRLALGLRRPRRPIAGRDVAGTVAQVGSAVTRFAVGDEVYGMAGGSFAEYAVAREAKLAPKPASLSFAQAAVVPISAGTALQALVDAGRVQADQSVLVIGASGESGRMRSSWPRRSVRTSPVCAARPSSTSSRHWAPTGSSTIATTTSPTAPGAMT